MAAIKSHTDLHQSKVLAKILPLESADMHYHYDSDFDELESIPTITEEDDHFVLFPKDVRCWSLAALLNVLPNSENISTNLSKGGYIISTIEYTNSWFVDYEDETDGLNNCVTSADNPVDACVAMIEKLHELKML